MATVLNIKNHFQKKDTNYEALLSTDVLQDICSELTGTTQFKVEFDNIGYNKGAWLSYFTPDILSMLVGLVLRKINK